MKVLSFQPWRWFLRVPVEYLLGLLLQPLSEEKPYYNYQKEVLKVLSDIYTMVKKY